MLKFEQTAWQAGYVRLAGVDEAGRGPLAGPVVAAAVHMERTALLAEAHQALHGLTDSKQLSSRKRELFYSRLTADARIVIGVGQSSVEEIDEINILRATHRAMARALAALEFKPDLALVDGRPVPGLPCPARAIIKGDAQSLLIAAASVVAKVTRDRLMLALDRDYPGYGFAIHKGYGTPAHLAALQTLGPCPAHRRSFAPLKTKPQREFGW